MLFIFFISLLLGLNLVVAANDNQTSTSTTAGNNPTTTTAGNNAPTKSASRHSTTAAVQRHTTTSVAVPHTKPAGNESSSSNCVLNTECGTCTQQWRCVWCHDPSASKESGHCTEGWPWGPVKGGGNIFKPGSAKNTTCPEFHWKVCNFLTGQILFYAVGGLAALIVFCFSCCILYCCCCRGMCKSKKSKGKELNSVRAEAKKKSKGKAKKEADNGDTEPLIKHHSHNDERRRQMREKWGIGSPTESV